MIIINNDNNNKIVNTEYLQRHNRVASFIHWILCKNFNLPLTEKPVTKSAEVTIVIMGLSDFTTNTDRKIEANRPDITTENFEENTGIMVDVTVPAYKNISQRVLEPF